MWNRIALTPTRLAKKDRATTWLYLAAGLVFLLVVIIALLNPPVQVSLLLPVLVLMGALAVWRPQLALLFVFAGAGLPALLVSLPGHTMRLIEPALLLCVALIVLYRPLAKLHLSHALALVFAAIALISFINVPDISLDPQAYAADKRLFTVLLGVAALFCGSFLIQYVKNISAFLVAVLLCNIPLFLIALCQLAGWPLPAGLEFPGVRELTQGRLWGPAPGAATFGLYLVNLFALALACWLLGAKRRERLIGGAMTLLSLLTIIGSGTRSALLGAVFVLFIALLLTRRYRLLLIVTACGGVGALLFLGQLLPLLTHEQASISNRLLLWHYALDLIRDHPWLGIGLQQFHAYYARLIVNPDTLLNARGISVHQQYLELALEGGIGWLLVGVLLLVSIGYGCWRSYRDLPFPWRVLPFATLLVLLANGITGFFDVPLDKAEGAVFLFLLAGMALGYIKQAQGPASSSCTIQKVSVIDIDPNKHAPGPENTEPDIPKTVRAISFQLLFWGLTGPVMFPITALLTHYLEPTKYGEYTFTLPFLAICALLSGTGMDPLIIRNLSRLPRERWSEELSYAAGSRLLSTGASVGIVCLIALLLPVKAELRNMLILGSISLFFSFAFNGWRTIYAHGFRAEQKVGVLITLESMSRLIMACMVILVVLLKLPLLWAYVLVIYSDLPCFIIQFFIARRRFGMRLRFSLAHLREHLLGSLSLTVSDGLALITNQADILLLTWFTSFAQVGLYSLALRISDPLLAMAFTYMSGLYPLLCSTFCKGRVPFARLYYHAIRMLSLALLPLSIFVTMQATSIVALLGGQQFADATLVVQLLFWATVVIFYSQLAVQSCMAAHMERLIPYVAGVGMMVNLLANLFLIPAYQAIGASIASLISESLSLLLFIILLRRHIFVWRTCLVVLQVLLGTLPMVVFLYLQQQAPLLLTIPVSIGLSITGPIVVGALTWRDMQMIKHFFFPASSLPEESRHENKTGRATPPLPVSTDFQDLSDCPTLILPRIRV